MFPDQAGHHVAGDPAAQATVPRVVVVHQQQLVQSALVHQPFQAEAAVLQKVQLIAQLVVV